VVHRSDDSDDGSHLDAEEKKAAAVAIRLPVIIAVALLLMLGMAVLAIKWHGGG